MGFIFQTSERDNEFVTHYRTKLGTRRADTSYRRRPLMTRCVTDIHAAAVKRVCEDPPWRIKARKLFGTTSRGRWGAKGRGGKRGRNYDTAFSRATSRKINSRTKQSSPSNDHSPNNSLDFLASGKEAKIFESSRAPSVVVSHGGKQLSFLLIYSRHK